MNNILMVGGTHGDEPIGVKALEAIESRRDDFDWIVGNPRALAENKRFTQEDLNRSAPGDLRSKIYEERRAAELIRLSQKYRYTVDLHGTSKDTGIFLIVTNPTRANLRLARMLDVERVVIWPAITPDLQSPVSEFYPCGLEIECGPKDSPEVQVQLEQIIEKFLDRDLSEGGRGDQTFYEVYGELKGDPGVNLEEFVEVVVDGETFTPLLVGTYQDAYGVACYKLKRVDPGALG
jgi:hypothetical protein